MRDVAGRHRMEGPGVGVGVDRDWQLPYGGWVRMRAARGLR